MARSEDYDVADDTNKGPVLKFVQQVGAVIQDPAAKLEIRSHAATVNGNKRRARHPGYWIPLEVPDSFTQKIPQDRLNHSESLVTPRDEVGVSQSGADDSNNHCSSTLTGDHTPSDINNRSEAYSSVLQKCSWATDAVVISRPAQEMSKVHSMHATPEHRARRTSKPKVRSGCVTCKSRHVKCDETIPACKRCMKLYGTCTGYTIHRDLETVKNSHISLSQPSVALRFRDNLEMLYFQVFQEETTSELTGLFHSSLWNRIILQECHHEDFVRHAVIAIGALSKSCKADWTARTCSKPTAKDWRMLAGSHREYAFKAYGAALQVMKSISPQDPKYLRRTLIACLLVFVFETFSGQVDMAFSHALIGDQLTCKFITRTPDTDPYTASISSPTSRIVEDEILSAYARLGLHMMTFRDQRSLITHQKGKITCSTTINGMPTVFSTLEEAELYWELIMGRCCHYASEAYVATQSVRLQKEFSCHIPGRGVEVTSGACIYSSPYIVPDWLPLESAEYSAEILRWSTAFNTLLNQARLDPQNNIGAMTLRIYALSINIVVEGTTFTEESSYDKFLSDFHEIVELTRHVSDVACQKPVFRLDLSVVPPLFIVILRCRDRCLRREAIAILGSSRCQDGPWDRQMMATAGSWIMGKEEHGIDSDHIPEQARVQYSRVWLGLEKRSMVVQCVRRVTAPGGSEMGEPQLTWEEDVLNW